MLVLSGTSPKLCKDCRYFKPDTFYGIREHRVKNGFCTHPSFQKTDIVNGNIHHEKAEDIRKNEKLCGIEGNLYIPESNLVAKVLRTTKFDDIGLPLFFILIFYLYAVILFDMKKQMD